MPEKPMTDQEKLAALRREIAAQGVDGFILPRTDAYMGEFLAPCDERLAWLSGFTGSAGYAVVLADRAAVMSDGRYALQLRAEVDCALYAVGSSIETPISAWIQAHAQAGAKIGYDPWLHTPKDIEALSGAGISLVPLARNPVDVIWAGRPAKPAAPVVLFPEAVAGKTTGQKRAEIAAMMRGAGADVLILTQADSICWLLNVRGGDVAYTPLVQSYALLKADGAVMWFVDPAKMRGLEIAGVTVEEPSGFEAALKSLKGRSVWVDEESAPERIVQVLRANDARVVAQKDPCAALKAIKTPQEQEAMREAHRRDGAAMVRFMMWFEAQGAAIAAHTEVSIAQVLADFRARDGAYAGESFATIAGYQERGAIIHYRAREGSDKRLEGEGILLLDSGAQYRNLGTTDITRCFVLGTPSAQMRADYTRVLKGHIALSMARFPLGTTGVQLDAMARAPLWAGGLDYAHGTGHGVGCYLGVHEEAASISPRGAKALAAGMVLSNEPGVYREGAYGIRIENLVLVRGDGDGLCFETLTLAPYEPRLIEMGMLLAEELRWLAAYSGLIQQALSAFLSLPEQAWLRERLDRF